MQKQIGILIFHLSCMNYGVWVVRHTSFKWKLKSCLEVFQVGFLDLDSFNDDYGMCLDAWNVLKLPGIACSNQAATCLVWDLMMMILMLQIMDECWDNSYMMFMWCLKWKFGKRTSGLRVSLLRLNLCFNGGWRVILSFGCFCEVWMIQTTFKWCLESVWSIGLVKTCKGWKLGF